MEPMLNEPYDLEFDDSASAISLVDVIKREDGRKGLDGLVFDDSEYSDSIVQSSGTSTGSADRLGNEMKKRFHAFGGVYTKTMRQMRIVFWLVLVCIMIVSTASIYFFILSSETSTFRTDFAAYGSKVLDAFQRDANRKLEALDSLSAFITTYAMDHEQQWPMVTMSHSAPLLERYLTLMRADAIHVLPIIPRKLRAEWETYAVQNQDWIDEALDESMYSREHKLRHQSKIRRLNEHGSDVTSSKSTNDVIFESYVRNNESRTILPFIHHDTGYDITDGPYAVEWQYAPVSTDRFLINYNRFDRPYFEHETHSVLRKRRAALSHSYNYSIDNVESVSKLDKSLAELLNRHTDHSKVGEPVFDMHYPIFEQFKNRTKVVAVLSATVHWKNVFEHILPKDVYGVICVVENSIGQVFTYQIDGLYTTYLGMDDLHDRSYDNLVVAGTFVATKHSRNSTARGNYIIALDEEFMSYSIRIYPSSQMKDVYLTNTPNIVSVAIAFLFLVTAAVFNTYDYVIARRQNFIFSRAAKTEDIVASLFPVNVRARIIGDVDDKDGEAKRGKIFASGQSVLSACSVLTNVSNDDPSMVIADFHPEVTVLFTDIKGFTAWCSEREPWQVFVLLETLYNTYDIVAKKRKVFKVETIGDCYMAVTGLPIPRADHAVLMCKFARDCLRKVEGLLRGLEVTLGPGTADLSMRFGIHTGPVTAGVIRSQNARFQLFGDTVNMASRMESTGEAGMIQISQETAQELIAKGKEHWFSPRETKISAKGKGELTTFWLNLLISDDDNQSCSTPSVASTPTETINMMADTVVQRRMSEISDQTIAVTPISSRLVDWHVEALCRLLEQIKARRSHVKKLVHHMVSTESSYTTVTSDSMPEIKLRFHDPDRPTGIKAAELDITVTDQVHLYVHTISMMYKDNAFHNFEHASHVALSVLKLLGRIVIPGDFEPDDARHLFSDPLTQLTCVLAALIHDVCHCGVPNNQMVVEQADVASLYNDESVTEQFSIDVAWGLLMQPEYSDLRGAIYCNQVELERFRYILVHAVMATDTTDKHVKEIRGKRWLEAFGTEPDGDASPHVISGHRDTMVVKTLMQASHISHAMQHWHVYRKWSEKMHQEAFTAYTMGRSNEDPSDGWYEGEIRHFDDCVIPLAKKLKDCGVFGVSCEECLNYATRNRNEWISRGEDIVEEMRSKVSS